MYDLASELQCADLGTLSEFEMLNEERRRVELLLAAETGEPLVDPVSLSGVSKGVSMGEDRGITFSMWLLRPALDLNSSPQIRQARP